MHSYTIAYAFLTLLSIGHTRFIIEEYTQLKNEIIEEELEHSLGGKLHLSENEAKANEIIMKWKQQEMDEIFTNPKQEEFWACAKKSKVYEVIRKMPKGAVLHIHSSFMLDADSLIELTYEFEEYLYVCYCNNSIELTTVTKLSKPCPLKWTPLSELRNESHDAQTIDAKLREHFCMDCGPRQQPETINEAWIRFESTHQATKPLIGLRPVREKYFYKSLEKLYDDNVRYVEIRSNMGSLFELDGTVHDKKFSARLYKNITDEFIKTHPDFMGVKFIITSYRGSTNEKVRQSLELAKQLKREMPELIAGFDLVGQEDLGRPLIDFLPEFQAAADEIDFYFHGGETNWFGTPSDENLIDAILLGTKRIGHGYTMIKHPSLLSIVKERDIPLEVNVVSNNRLNLVTDMRNHPLASYLAMDIPVVLSSDDPTAFKTDPLSHDFYVAFVSIGSRRYDLRMLKKLAMNSIKYSALNSDDKETMYRIFENDWRKFIMGVISTEEIDFTTTVSSIFE